eukprot:15446915-Alexandrium_andersonii.AAC.1
MALKFSMVLKFRTLRYSLRSHRLNPIFFVGAEVGVPLGVSQCLTHTPTEQKRSISASRAA